MRALLLTAARNAYAATRRWLDLVRYGRRAGVDIAQCRGARTHKMRVKRAVECRLARKRHIVAIEQSRQHLRVAMARATAFTIGTLCAFMTMQLFIAPVPLTPSLGSSALAFGMYMRVVIALIFCGFLGSTLAFRFLPRSFTISRVCIALLGAMFTVAAIMSFAQLIEVLGRAVALLALAVLAAAVAFLGARLLGGR